MYTASCGALCTTVAARGAERRGPRGVHELYTAGAGVLLKYTCRHELLTVAARGAERRSP